MSTAEITVLTLDPACTAWLRPSKMVRVLRTPVQKVARESRNIFVLALASQLSEVARFVREANQRHCLRALLVHADLDARWVGQMLYRADLRTLRNLLVHDIPGVPRRVVRAWRHGAQDDLIADATVVGDLLMIMTCALERIEVEFAAVPALRRIGARERDAFEIDPDGSFLYWPTSDIHLDVDALRVAVDPAARQRALAERLRHSQGVGRAIAQIRKEHGLAQGVVEGVSARQVRRIEAGEFFPRMSTFEKLATAHGLKLGRYLDAVAAAQA